MYNQNRSADSHPPSLFINTQHQHGQPAHHLQIPNNHTSPTSPFTMLDRRMTPEDDVTTHTNANIHHNGERRMSEHIAFGVSDTISDHHSTPIVLGDDYVDKGLFSAPPQYPSTERFVGREAMLEDTAAIQTDDVKPQADFVTGSLVVGQPVLQTNDSAAPPSIGNTSSTTGNSSNASSKSNLTDSGKVRLPYIASAFSLGSASSTRSMVVHDKFPIPAINLTGRSDDSCMVIIDDSANSALGVNNVTSHSIDETVHDTNNEINEHDYHHDQHPVTHDGKALLNGSTVNSETNKSSEYDSDNLPTNRSSIEEEESPFHPLNFFDQRCFIEWKKITFPKAKTPNKAIISNVTGFAVPGKITAIGKLKFIRLTSIELVPSVLASQHY